MGEEANRVFISLPKLSWSEKEDESSLWKERKSGPEPMPETPTKTTTGTGERKRLLSPQPYQSRPPSHKLSPSINKERRPKSSLGSREQIERGRKERRSASIKESQGEPNVKIVMKKKKKHREMSPQEHFNVGHLNASHSSVLSQTDSLKEAASQVEGVEMISCDPIPPKYMTFRQLYGEPSGQQTKPIGMTFDIDSSMESYYNTRFMVKLLLSDDDLRTVMVPSMGTVFEFLSRVKKKVDDSPPNLQLLKRLPATTVEAERQWIKVPGDQICARLINDANLFNSRYDLRIDDRIVKFWWFSGDDIDEQLKKSVEVKVLKRLFHSKEPLETFVTFLEPYHLRQVLTRNTRNICHLAARSGRLDVLKWAYSQSPSLVIETDIYGFHPLHYACQKGHLHIALGLLRNGVEVVLGPYRMTCLHFLVSPRVESSLKDSKIDPKWFSILIHRLVADGCGLNAKDSRGLNALQLACIKKYYSIVTAFLQYGSGLLRPKSKIIPPSPEEEREDFGERLARTFMQSTKVSRTEFEGTVSQRPILAWTFSKDGYITEEYTKGRDDVIWMDGVFDEVRGGSDAAKTIENLRAILLFSLHSWLRELAVGDAWKLLVEEKIEEWWSGETGEELDEDDVDEYMRPMLILRSLREREEIKNRAATMETPPLPPVDPIDEAEVTYGAYHKSRDEGGYAQVESTPRRETTEKSVESFSDVDELGYHDDKEEDGDFESYGVDSVGDSSFQELLKSVGNQSSKSVDVSETTKEDIEESMSDIDLGCSEDEDDDVECYGVVDEKEAPAANEKDEALMDEKKQVPMKEKEALVTEKEEGKEQQESDKVGEMGESGDVETLCYGVYETPQREGTEDVESYRVDDEVTELSKRVCYHMDVAEEDDEIYDTSSNEVSDDESYASSEEDEDDIVWINYGMDSDAEHKSEGVLPKKARNQFGQDKQTSLPAIGTNRFKSFDEDEDPFLDDVDPSEGDNEEERRKTYDVKSDEIRSKFPKRNEKGSQPMGRKKPENDLNGEMTDFYLLETNPQHWVTRSPRRLRTSSCKWQIDSDPSADGSEKELQKEEFHPSAGIEFSSSSSSANSRLQRENSLKKAKEKQKRKRESKLSGKEQKTEPTARRAQLPKVSKMKRKSASRKSNLKGSKLLKRTLQKKSDENILSIRTLTERSKEFLNKSMSGSSVSENEQTRYHTTPKNARKGSTFEPDFVEMTPELVHVKLDQSFSPVPNSSSPSSLASTPSPRNPSNVTIKEEFAVVQEEEEIRQYGEGFHYLESLKQSKEAADRQRSMTMSELTNDRILAADNWIDRFHMALKGIRGSANPLTMSAEQIRVMIQRYSTLIELAQDFVYTAKTYGRIIISERFVEHKTIKPVGMGGQAGGEKYIVQNILFKFAVDSSNMYNGDFAAAKVAALELKGSIAYFNVSSDQDLRLPMIALVDYFGFRLIAISLLPIGEGTLVYGTCDAGHTIYASDECFNSIMRQTALRLNIQSHQCGSGISPNRPNSSAYLHSAADVEGHLGRDGHYYLLDFSRTMPPCPPDPTLPSSHLFRLFRSEFVAKYPVPLCPDGFSGFLRADPDRKNYNAQLRLAFQSLIDVNCHEFARRVPWHIMEAREKGDLSSFPLSQELHSVGINLRYLGIILDYIPITGDEMSIIVRSFILCEILARIIKNEINALLRDSMFRWQIPMEARYRSAVVEYLNFVLIEDGVNSLRYWNTYLKGLAKRFFHLKAPYTQKGFHLRPFVLCGAGTRKSIQHLSKKKKKSDSSRVAEYFIQRIAALSAVHLSPMAIDKVLHQQPLNMWDLEGFNEKVKHMNIIADATGTNFCLHGFELQQQGDFETAAFYFRQAVAKYKMALQSNPTNPLLLEHMAFCLASEVIARTIIQSEKPTPKVILGHWPEVQLQQSDQDVQQADNFFLRAIDANPHNPSLLGYYAKFLLLCGRVDRAENYYLRSLERSLDPEVLQAYVQLMSDKGLDRYAYLLNRMLNRLLAREDGIRKIQISMDQWAISKSKSPTRLF